MFICNALLVASNQLNSICYVSLSYCSWDRALNNGANLKQQLKRKSIWKPDFQELLTNSPAQLLTEVLRKSHQPLQECSGAFWGGGEKWRKPHDMHFQFPWQRQKSTDSIFQTPPKHGCISRSKFTMLHSASALQRATYKQRNKAKAVQVRDQK